MNVEALQNVQLKKVEKGKETSKPNVSVDSIQQEKEANARLRACDLEAWYEVLKPYTFKTVFVPLEVEEARAMMKYYMEKPTERHSGEEVLRDLENKIGDYMKKEFHGESVFAKLSSRSPKDSQMCQDRALESVKQKLLAKGRKVDGNDVMIAIMGSSIEGLRLDSAAEVMQCFLSSDRVCADDIPLALSFAEKLWTQHICLREFVSIPTSHEFRCFVYDRKLTALSQYYVPAYFPEIEKDRVLDLVQKMFDEIKDICPLDPPEYSIDLAVDVQRGRCYVIELNPFGKPDGMGTGTVLFSNKDPNDLDILFGKSPFEFRTVTSNPNLDIDKTVKGPLKQFLVDNKLI